MDCRQRDALSEISCGSFGDYGFSCKCPVLIHKQAHIHTQYILQRRKDYVITVIEEAIRLSPRGVGIDVAYCPRFFFFFFPYSGHGFLMDVLRIVFSILMACFLFS